MPNYLILLVGGNTLPNYVVATYLSEKADAALKPDKIILVSSKEMDTAGVTARLKTAIQVKLKLEPILASWHNTKTGDQLATEIATILDKNLTNQAHLNYTGGTKQMAVCAIQALGILDQKSQVSSTYLSYLDASSNSLRYEKSSSLTAPTADLRCQVWLNVEEVLSLNKDKGKISNYTETPFYPDLADHLRKMASGVEPGGREWFCVNYKPWILKNSADGDKLNPASQGTPMNVSTLGDDFENLVAREWGKRDLLWSELDQEKLDFLLKGKWLSQVILANIKKFKNEVEPGISDFRANLKIDGFETDLLILQGYHLTLVACTTIGCINFDIDLEDRLRGKAFEALHRAEQLGGEEARVMLITLAEPKLATRLEQDLKTSFGTGKSKFKVWSYAQLYGNEFKTSFLNFLNC